MHPPPEGESQTFRGTAELLDFLRHQGGEFTCTTELLGGRWIDEALTGPFLYVREVTDRRSDP